MSKEIDSATIKNELDIYWQKNQTDEKIKRYIAEGKNILRDYTGAELSFTEGSQEGRLLIAYVSYAYNKMSEYFETNYQADLIKLRLKHQGADYGEN